MTGWLNYANDICQMEKTLSKYHASGRNRVDAKNRGCDIRTLLKFKSLSSESLCLFYYQKTSRPDFIPRGDSIKVNTVWNFTSTFIASIPCECAFRKLS